MKRLLPSRFEILVILAVWAAMGVLLWPLVRRPAGPRIPTSPPEESRRYHHRDGFSLVVPANWDVREFDGILALTPQTSFEGVRSPTGLSIMTLGPEQPREIELAKEALFRGRPAWERMELVRKGTFDDPPLSTYTLYFQRHEEWWVASYFLAESLTEVPPMVRRYIETLQWE